jgi:hypothetical protein
MVLTKYGQFLSRATVEFSERFETDWILTVTFQVRLQIRLPATDVRFITSHWVYRLSVR